MTRNKTKLLKNNSAKGVLHRFVFESVLVKSAVMTLLIFFAVQPVSMVFAEEVPVDDSAETVSPIMVNSEVDDADVAEETELSTVNEETDEPILNIEEDEEESADGIVIIGEPVTDSEPGGGGSSGSNVDISSDDSGTDDTTFDEADDWDASIGEGGGGSGTTTSTNTAVQDGPNNDSYSSNETTATSDETFEEDEDVASTTVSAHYSDGNKYQFSAKECIRAGSGAYYCSEASAAPNYIEDGVFAAPDLDGDMEIFLRLNNETVQLTKNTYDDSAPYYDSRSNTIVWHAVKNERYQIVSYSLDTNEVTWITDERYNNMEPVAYGDLVLWQAWIKNNWEIMMFNGKQTLQLTQNDVQDITPQVREDTILWQTQFADGWKVAVYDTKTNKVEYVADSDGGKVNNPRFVLVFDSENGSGDVRTLGYDPRVKTIFSLGVLPDEMPDELPEPDQTGEIRALLTNKSTRDLEEDTDAILGNNNLLGTSTPPVVGEFDLVISSSTPSTTDFVIETNIVTDIVATGSEAVAQIEDLVIQSYSPEEVPE